ncbi:hypothetical protein QVD17_17367 [Tagetes erecta]|uniref:F-box domain-containing protein n=1 Tax=Tagetes erecta TaxID=13708 RepID=A0AAD8KY90_TARER|nr:hypothetical protein QVD17_17367 [Tagetes erecta]
MIPYHKNLTARGYRALIFSGDHDMCVPFTGSEAWTRSLGYEIIDEWRKWQVDGQVSGFIQGYNNNLTFLTVKIDINTISILLCMFSSGHDFDIVAKKVTGYIQMARNKTIEDVGEDLLQIIVAKLPALTFASAACVSRSWNCVCGRVLSRPKFSSACSTKPTLEAAFEEVANKVLSEPIRPQFAIACVNHFSMQQAKRLMTAKLSSKVPFIIGTSAGLIGRDAISGEFNENEQGMMLTVGYAPGLKVKSISLVQEPQPFMIDQFIADIKEFSTSISGCPSPSAIMMFGRAEGLMNVMEKLDNAMAPETVIVGACHFHCKQVTFAAAYALVFVMDRNKPPGGAGETRFHAVLSRGLSPTGPTFKVVSVEVFDDEDLGQWGLDLTGVREGTPGTFDRSKFPLEYIGVTKRRIRDIVQKEAKWTTSFSFYYIIDDDIENDEFLYVSNLGIEVGDTYQYYYEDSSTIRSSVDSVSKFLRSFKKRSANGSDKSEVCGGLLFTSYSRGEQFLGKENPDGNAFLESFPGVTLAGATCDEEIGRGYLATQESQEPQSARACLHRCSAVYFIISYTP